MLKYSSTLKRPCASCKRCEKCTENLPVEIEFDETLNKLIAGIFYLKPWLLCPSIWPYYSLLQLSQDVTRQWYVQPDTPPSQMQRGYSFTTGQHNQQAEKLQKHTRRADRKEAENVTSCQITTGWSGSVANTVRRTKSAPSDLYENTQTSRSCLKRNSTWVQPIYYRSQRCGKPGRGGGWAGQWLSHGVWEDIDIFKGSNNWRDNSDKFT